MNKLLIAIAAFSATFLTALADGQIYSLGEPKTSDAMGKAMLRKQGGLLKKPGSFEGKICIIDGRERSNAEEFVEALSKLAQQQGFHIEIRTQKVDVAKTRAVLDSFGAKVGVVVVDNDITPTLLVSPDEGYALVNAKKIVVGVEQSRLASLRIKKQLLRAVGYVCGGMSSQYDGTLAAPVQKPSDLDLMPQELPMDVVFAFRKYLAFYGITPYVRSTYRRACQEGWAPQPTNSFQKAVWDEVHSLPTKPITIKYDKNKGE
jgi:hypothetical protein